jgi:Na+/glutamate symporter
MLTASININIIVTTLVKKYGIENHNLKNSPSKNTSMVNINNTAAWYKTNFDTMLLNFLEVIFSFNLIALAIPNIVSNAIAVPTDINSPWIGAKNNRRVVKIYVK